MYIAVISAQTEYNEVMDVNSIWTQTVQLPRFPILTSDRKTDVLVVGGGMAPVTVPASPPRADCWTIPPQIINLCEAWQKAKIPLIDKRNCGAYNELNEKRRCRCMEQEYKWTLPDELEFEYLDGSSSLFHTFAAELEHTFHLANSSCPSWPALWRYKSLY